MGRWRRGKWEREPRLPSPHTFFAFLFTLTVLTERRFTTILGALNRLSFVQISSIYWKTAAKDFKLVSKMALKKCNTNFCLKYFIRKNRTTFPDVPLLPEIFRWEADPKSRVPFTFQPDFPESFLQMVVVNHLQNFFNVIIIFIEMTFSYKIWFSKRIS